MQQIFTDCTSYILKIMYIDVIQQNDKISTSIN